MELPLIEKAKLFQGIQVFRSKLLKLSLVVGLVAIASSFFLDVIIPLLEKPLGFPLVLYAPGEALVTIIKICIFTSLFLTFPFLLYELWTALAPIFITISTMQTCIIVLSSWLLFLSGVLLCYMAVLPFAIQFLIGFGGEHLEPLLSANRYLTFVMTLIFAFGVIFELPLILLLLARIGIVTAPFLSKYRRYAILVIAIASAVITPTPDAYTMLLMAAPLYLLYEVSIILIKLFGKHDRVTSN
ncbi:MAG: twin-arginine translocase subunit TatC [Candidatus Tectomicrobia bacterium]|nr:twin-arginine translocase subunit TatC [Candidatus Tectomicrobia bacterium]